MRMQQRLALTATTFTALMTTAAPAQQNETDASVMTPESEPAQLADAGRLHFALYGGAEHQFTSNLNGPGDFNVSRLDGGLNLSTQLQPNLKLSAGISYSRDFYDFDGPTSLAMTDPWEDINTVGLGAIFTYHMHEDWRLYTGPVFQLAAEDGADLTDGFTGGGVIGIAHDFTNEFTLGVGVGVISQIEDDVQVFPAIQLEWAISDDFRLTSSAASGGRRSGLELVWDAYQDWQVGLGLAYEFDRFRLDDGGAAPDGVGQDERLPLHVRLTYTDNATTFNFYAGVVLDGELRLENDDGRRISDRSYDRAEFIALSISHRF